MARLAGMLPRGVFLFALRAQPSAAKYSRNMGRVMLVVMDMGKVSPSWRRSSVV